MTQFLTDDQAKELITQFVNQRNGVTDMEVYQYLQACALAVTRGEMVMLAAEGYGTLGFTPPDKFSFTPNERGRTKASRMKILLHGLEGDE